MTHSNKIINLLILCVIDTFTITMALNMSLVNGTLEALLRYVGDFNFELSEIPSSLIAGSIVGACSVIGGLIGGKAGVLIGEYQKY